MESCSLLSCGYKIHTKPLYSERVLQFFLIRFQAEGSSQISINGQAQEYHPGDLLVASPGDHYALKTGLSEHGESVRCVDYFFYCQTKEVEPFGDHPRKLHIGMDDPFLNILKNLVYERRKLKDQDLDIQDYSVRLAFLYIRRFLSRNSVASNRHYLSSQMRNYIEQHATESLTLKQVASHAGLGISRASELFKATFGNSIMDYANEVKLNIARNYILFETSTLEEIAYSSGFGSYTHFSRMFRKRFGVSPSKYRETNR
ncbi:AraC family transcriptional regulator [Paenibacillus oryzisoli]|uniref:helix-turn-helix domain-containing protein n=1 Tax=Paenibacillus oryzisoli TaxID=1850517 RepID=UPI003D2D72F4